MSNIMDYKGYTGSVEYSAEDRLLYGGLVGIRDRVLFDGKDVRTLEKNFRGAVDEYLAFCKEEGRLPDKPFKGSLNIRIPSELHRVLTVRAEQQHKSLNSVIAEQLASSMGLLPAVGDAVALGLAGHAGVVAGRLAHSARRATENRRTDKVRGAHGEPTAAKMANPSRRKTG